ncbi:hypothetical protein [Pseudarthrobacter sp. AB1]|uniref:hypothetical protein n=1 Tax=Pseudarthrobacter sp. AB1 TaxID=2138309 RepID=UPI00186B886B|nr:hypothetical protein [Pseudarthrobacter sp. AB1]
MHVPHERNSQSPTRARRDDDGSGLLKWLVALHWLVSIHGWLSVRRMRWPSDIAVVTMKLRRTVSEVNGSVRSR